VVVHVDVHQCITTNLRVHGFKKPARQVKQYRKVVPILNSFIKKKDLGANSPLFSAHAVEC
jgi:hypothetical protein